MIKFDQFIDDQVWSIYWFCGNLKQLPNFPTVRHGSTFHYNERTTRKVHLVRRSNSLEQVARHSIFGLEDQLEGRIISDFISLFASLRGRIGCRAGAWSARRGTCGRSTTAPSSPRQGRTSDLLTNLHFSSLVQIFFCPQGNGRRQFCKILPFLVEDSVKLRKKCLWKTYQCNSEGRPRRECTRRGVFSPRLRARSDRDRRRSGVPIAGVGIPLNWN